MSAAENTRAEFEKALRDRARRRINSVVHDLLGALDGLRQPQPEIDTAQECIVDALTKLHGMKLDCDEVDRRALEIDSAAPTYTPP